MSDVRFARVPTGRETCGFCFMLASQGYVYRSAATAARSHPGCDCVAVPGIPDPGDDERFAGMRQRWQDCLDAVDNGSTLRRGKAAWAAMDGAERARHAGKRGEEAAFRGWYRDDFLLREACREVERRDRGWLYDGVAPKVSYVSKEVERRATAAEVATAERLAEMGVKPVFVQDYEWVTGVDGRKRKLGLPDLDGGIEIKTLQTSGNAYGAVDNYLENASGKKGLTCVVIDNAQSERIQDEDLIAAVLEIMPRYMKIPMVRLILKSGACMVIK